jgi:hypothetical protein
MSYIKPNIPIITNPSGLEIPIQTIQQELGTGLSWLEKSFGRAWMHSEYSTDGKTKKYPKCWDGVDYINVLPNDNFKAMSFIAVKAQEKYAKFSDAAVGNPKTRDLSVIIWGNLKKIDPAKTYIFTEYLKLQVEKILVPNVAVITAYYDEKAETVFQDYTLIDIDTQYLMYPFFAMRFDVTVDYFDTYCTT